MWGDTERDGQHLRDMDNHRNQPEIQEALADGIGTIDRYSDTVMTTLRYLALPVVREEEMIGICRVALPMMEIDTAISQLRWLLLLAISAGLVFAILFSIITTNATTKPIRDLTQATKSLAIGELNSRVSVAASGELGELSNNFNQMNPLTIYETCKIKKPYSAKSQIGLRVTLPDGFEPPTKWLTATCSTS